MVLCRKKLVAELNLFDLKTQRT